MLDPYDPKFHARDWEAQVEGTVSFAVVGLGWFGREISPDGEHGLADMRYLEAVYESDEMGERIDV